MKKVLCWMTVIVSAGMAAVLAFGAMNAEAVEETVGDTTEVVGTERVMVVYKKPELPEVSRENLAERAEILEAERADLEQEIEQAENMELEGSLKNVPAIVVTTDESGIESLRARSDVEAVLTDKRVETYVDYRAPLTAIGGNINLQKPAYANGANYYDGNDYEVVVIDSGISPTHVVFDGKIAAEACFSYSGGPDDDNRLSSLCPDGEQSSTLEGAATDCDLESCGHGTMVAGAVAMGRVSFTGDFTAMTSGAATGAKVIPIKVATQSTNAADCAEGDSPPCAVFFLFSIVWALDHVIDLAKDRDKIAAVNISLGGGAANDAASCTAVNGSYETYYYDLFEGVIGDLKELGIATVIAAGNSGYGKNQGKIGFPACVESAIAVSATDPYDDKVAYYSQNGTLTTLLAPGGDNSNKGDDVNYHVMWLPIQKDGKSIPSDIFFGGVQGTSFAAPTAAGAYAVLRSKFPTASVDELTELLVSTGVSIEDTRSGYEGLTKPLIQVDKALAETDMPEDEEIYIKSGTLLKDYVTDLSYPFEYEVNGMFSGESFTFSSGRTPYMRDAALGGVDETAKLPTGTVLRLKSYPAGEAINRAYNLIVRGDATKDAKIDNSDIVLISRYLRDLATLDDNMGLAADVTKSGTVDNSDIVMISRYLRGLVEGEW